MIFKNRQVQYPNYKRLIIHEVNRDGLGNVTDIIVSEEPYEGTVYVEGTPLDERTLNLMINHFYYQEQSIQIISSSLERKVISIELDYLMDVEISIEGNVSHTIPVITNNSCTFEIYASNNSQLTSGDELLYITVTFKKHLSNEIVGTLNIPYTYISDVTTPID